MKKRALLAALSALVFGISALDFLSLGTYALGQTTYTWTGAAGTNDFSTAGNWDINSAPGDNAIVNIYSGSVSSDNSALKSTMTLNLGDGTSDNSTAILNTRDLKGTANLYKGATLTVNNDNCLWGALNIQGGALTGDILHLPGSINLSSGLIRVSTLRLGYRDANQILQSGGEATIGSALIGYNKDGTYNLSGGSFNVTGGMTIGSANTTGVFTQSGTGSSSVADNMYIGNGANANGKLTVSSGTFSVRSVDIGCNTGVGEVVLDGGTISHSSGTPDFIVGNGSGLGTFTIKSGTLSLNTGSNLVIGSGTAGETGGGTMTIQSGNHTVGYVSVTQNSTGAKGTLNIEGGTLQINNDFRVGMNSGNAVVKQSAGDVKISGTLGIGLSGSVGTYYLSGGTLSFPGAWTLGTDEGTAKMVVSGTGVLDLTKRNDIYIGNGGAGTLQLDSGGTVKVSNNNGAANTNNTWINVGESSSSSSVGNLILNGGSFKAYSDAGAEQSINYLCAGRRGEGHVTLNGLDHDLAVSTIYVGFSASKSGNSSLVINGGTMKTNSLYVSHGGENTGSNLGVCTLELNSVGKLVVSGDTWVSNGAGTNGKFEINGGTLESSGSFNLANVSAATFSMNSGALTVNNWVIGHSGKATATVFGGAVQAVNLTLDKTGTTGSILNLNGSDSSWNITGNLTVNASGVVNVNFGSTGDNSFLAANGKFKDAISTINVNSNATVNGTINVDASNYYFNGMGAVQGSADQVLLKAGTLAGNPTIHISGGPWEVDQAKLQDGEVRLVVDGTAMDLSASNIICATGEKGWLNISGDPGQQYSTQFYYAGIESEQLTDMIDWLNESAVTGETFSLLGDTVLLSGLSLDEDGQGVLSWNFAAFNAEHESALRIGNVPEPATWSLLLIGLAGVWYIRRKR